MNFTGAHDWISFDREDNFIVTGLLLHDVFTFATLALETGSIASLAAEQGDR